VIFTQVAAAVEQPLQRVAVVRAAEVLVDQALLLEQQILAVAAVVELLIHLDQVQLVDLV
jgi:hypothetical protein